MKKIAIFYGSSTGNTQNAANAIKGKLSGNEVDVLDVANAGSADIEKYNNLIFGTSTWGIGDLQDDWESFINVIEKTDLNGKIVALFGLGDAYTYSDSFVDGMGTIYETIENKGAKIIGKVKTDGYNFDESKAVVDNYFVGLALDEDNESNLTNSRIENWVSEIEKDFI